MAIRWGLCFFFSADVFHARYRVTKRILPLFDFSPLPRRFVLASAVDFLTLPSRFVTENR